jgi:hypothetical protein
MLNGLLFWQAVIIESKIKREINRVRMVLVLVMKCLFKGKRIFGQSENLPGSEQVCQGRSQVGVQEGETGFTDPGRSDAAPFGQ